MTRGPAALAIAGTVSIAACTQSRGDAFEREATRVEGALTIPEGTRLVERGARMRSPLYVAQTWQLRAAGDWAPYAKGLEGTISDSYRCSPEATAMVCRRWLPGDVFRLRVEGEPTADGLAIRAELNGSPD